MMSALIFLLLIGAAVLTLLPRNRVRSRLPAATGFSAQRQRGALGRRLSVDSRMDFPVLLRQLATLLESGQSGPRLWSAVAIAARVGDFDRAVLAAAQHATDLGESVSAAIRRCVVAAGQDGAGVQCRGWLALASGIEVSEVSGAPLAAVLHRLATGLEQAADIGAQLETALAGPRSAARLLAWLPAGGLLLGVGMGADPLGTLLGGPVGWAIGLAGMTLMALGRAWSRLLLRRAEGP